MVVMHSFPLFNLARDCCTVATPGGRRVILDCVCVCFFIFCSIVFYSIVIEGPLRMRFVGVSFGLTILLADTYIQFVCILWS